MKLEIIRFPDLNTADEDGLLAMGGELKVNWLYSAYSQGVFPWPQEGLPMLWFFPRQRGILDFAKVHFSKSFHKFRNKTEYQVTFNKVFSEVIKECKNQKRPGQKGTWITEEMQQAYTDFHQAGYAHSVEIWMEQKLVGGIYGVFVEGVFSAESMFYKKDNASKLALFHLIERLKELQLSWIDIQMVTPMTESLGGEYLDPESFLKRLKTSQNSELSKIHFK